MSRKRSAGKSGLLSLILLIALAAVAFWGWQRYTGFADAPLVGTGGDKSIVVQSGDSLPVVVRKLADAGVDTGEAIEWRLLAKQLGAAGKLQVGEYALPEGLTPRALLQAMRDGKVISHRFTIVEGWNIRELRTALAKARPLEQETAGLDDAALMKAVGQAGQHPEGRFLPETYVYTRGDSDLDVLKRAHEAMAKALEAAWAERNADTPLKSPDEMLTLASIVEKETGIAEERPQIAGLFEQLQTLADALAYPPRLAEYRHRQALAEQEHRDEDHAEERQEEFSGKLAHGCKASIQSGRNSSSGSSMPRLASTSRNAGTMPVGR